MKSFESSKKELKAQNNSDKSIDIDELDNAKNSMYQSMIEIKDHNFKKIKCENLDCNQTFTKDDEEKFCDANSNKDMFMKNYSIEFEVPSYHV